MGLEPLLTLLDTPDPDALPDEPFYHEGRFIGLPAQAVEHEDQQDIELSLLGPLLDELQLVTVICADLVPGDTSLLFLAYDGPAHPIHELPAGFPLHGDVRVVVHIVVDLFCGGNSV